MKAIFLVTVFSISAHAADPDFICKNKEYELRIGPDQNVELKLANGVRHDVKVKRFEASSTIPNSYRISGSTPEDEIFISTRTTLNESTLMLDYELKLQKYDSYSGGYSLLASVFRNCTPKQKVSFTPVK